MTLEEWIHLTLTDDPHKVAKITAILNTTFRERIERKLAEPPPSAEQLERLKMTKEGYLACLWYGLPICIIDRVSVIADEKKSRYEVLGDD